MLTKTFAKAVSMRATSFTLNLTKITHTSEKHKNEENQENRKNRKNTKTQKHTSNNLGCGITYMGLGFVFFSKSRMLYFKREVEVWKFPKKKVRIQRGGLPSIQESLTCVCLWLAP